MINYNLESDKIIPDTNYLIDVISGEKDALEKSKRLKRKGISQKICTPVIYEVLAGIEFVGSKKERIKFNSLLNKFPILTFDFNSAQLCAEIDAELRKEGETRSPVDIQIASIALSNNVKLLTRDSDFDIIAEVFELEVERY